VQAGEARRVHRRRLPSPLTAFAAPLVAYYESLLTYERDAGVQTEEAGGGGAGAA